MITHVAIRTKDGKVWSLAKPYRHDAIIYMIISNRVSLDESLEGFLADGETFLNRYEAWQHAMDCKQILPPYNPINPNQRCGEPITTPGPLFSEDVW